VPLEGVVNALRNVHRMLAPKGNLLDLHPIAPDARAERAGRLLGSVDGAEWWRDVEAMERSVDVLVAEGLLVPAGEARFDVIERFSSGDDALAEMTSWRGTTVPEALAAGLAGPDPVDVIETLVLRAYERRPR
jgi:hypothetical protein